MSAIQLDCRIGVEDHGASLSVEEFDALEWESCDPDYRYELVDGVLIVLPAPSAGERGPNGLLGHLLRSYRDGHPRGRAMDYTLPEQDVRTNENRRRADRVVWCGLGRMPNLLRDLPSIAVEFVSAALRDRLRDYEEKRDEYAAVKIPEYWIIDRFQRSMTVHRTSKRGRTETINIQESDVYRTPLLPGFELPLDRLLQEADEIAEAMDDVDETES